LDKSNIKVAEFITKVLPRKLLAEKLHFAVEMAKNQMDKNKNI
jgi:hypothetical protein